MPNLSSPLRTGAGIGPQLQSLHTDVSFTIGAEAANAIIVSIQLKDARTGLALAERRAVHAYFSDDANGDTLQVTAASGAVAISTNGVMIDQVAKKAFTLISEANGLIDITITEAAAKTAYLIVVVGGILHASAAIAFV